MIFPASNRKFVPHSKHFGGMPATILTSFLPEAASRHVITSFLFPRTHQVETVIARLN